MNSHPIITEINISRPARALAWLRLTDYALVVICGFMAVGSLSELVVNFPSNDPGYLIISLILLAILCFAAYTGWRHVGVIDPAIWRVYRVMFPLLAVVCLFLGLGVLVAYGSLASLMESKQAKDLFVSLYAWVWIGSVALLGWISLMLLRRMNISAMGATVEQILLGLAKKAGVTAKRATDIKRINKPRGLVIGSAGLLVLLTLILAPEPSNKLLANAFSKMGKEISLLGFFLLVRARRYFQIDADSLLAVDHRAPILFLRSFDDDEKQKFVMSDKALLDFSLETRLSNHFSRFGPFIAIGSPKETIPQLGAARVLLSDEEWQPRVLGWMREVGLIIMYSGKTHWVNWELRQIVENECATRLILMFPEIKAWRSSKRNEEISERVKQVREAFKNTPWEEELLEFNDFPGLRAMLFRPDGSMIMIRSRSRRRDSYHLAALIAHQYLLDPDNIALDADAGERTPHVRRSLVTVGALVAAVIAVLGAVYLFTERGDSRLAFKQGELLFSEPVTEDEARSVGEYLVQQQFFSDEQENTVQLLHEQERYRLRFVISPEFIEDPFTAIQLGMLGRQIATDVLGGKPVEVGFTDNQLKLIKVVPQSALVMFGKGELYYTEPVTRDEANRVGEYLVQQQFFSDEQESTVQLYQEQGQYLLRFVIGSEYAEDPLTAIQFGTFGSQIARDVLGGSPIEVGFTDDRLKLTRIVPSSAKMAFGKGELYYTEPVSATEAHAVGELIRQSGFFSDERLTSAHVCQEDGVYQLRFVIDSVDAVDPLTAILFGMLGSQIARDVLGGKPIKVGLTDDRINLMRAVPMCAKVMFGKGELYYTEPVTAAEANAVGEGLMHLGFFNDERGTSVHIGREGGAYQLKFVIEPTSTADPEVKAAFIELSRGIADEALEGRPVDMHLCDQNFRTLRGERL